MKPKDILELIAEIWKEISAPLPPWLVITLEFCKLAIVALLGLWALLFLAVQIKKLWLEFFGPLFYDEEKKQRRHRRRLFADHIECELRRLDSHEEWSDYRFTELEAEVEAEGEHRRFGVLPWRRKVLGLRRERSLSRALRTSTERLILLEGEPGAGKSVALRHVAGKLARRAMQSWRLGTLIPIYVNLKELHRGDGRSIDSGLIQDFVLASLNRVNSRDVDEFLEEEFTHGLREGTWLFLFDSFDELPEVLSATEASGTVRKYADAIADFLSGFNQCRGIVASRAYRGPRHVVWPKFRILPLTENRREQLVQRSKLSVEQKMMLIGQLATATSDLRAMASNPMFLSLVCDRKRDGLELPENAHSVFETYVSTRLARDEQRLAMRFKIGLERLREVAEAAAFTMTADRDLGLSPQREKLERTICEQGFAVREDLRIALNALEYIKLIRSETTVGSQEMRSLTFAHRRIQEYFATCVVLREVDRVKPKTLLRDARWRETTVVIFQTQPVERFGLLLRMVALELEAIEEEFACFVDKVELSKIRRACPWPDGALHLLGILQDGFKRRLADLPEEIREQVARMVMMASCSGTLLDRKLAMEVAGTLPEHRLLKLLQEAFETSSELLKDVAFRQAAYLTKIPEDVARGIRFSLERLARTGRLWRERFATEAHLQRLDGSARYLKCVQLLHWSRRATIASKFLTGVLLSHWLVFIITNPLQSFVPILNAYLCILAYLVSPQQNLWVNFGSGSLPSAWYRAVSRFLELR